MIIKKILAVVLFGIILLLNSFVLFNKQAYNYDIIPYSALILGMNKENCSQVHEQIYSELKSTLTQSDYQELTGTNNIRRFEVFNDPHKLLEQLPGYAVKPLYWKMAQVMHRHFGVKLFQSTFIPGLIFYILLCILFFAWVNRIVLNGWYAVAIGTVMLFNPILLLNTVISTPDMMCAFLCFLSFFFLIGIKKTNWGMFFMAMAILSRIDIIIPGLSFLFFWYYFREINKLECVLWTAVFITCFFFVTSFSSKYGWPVLFYNRYTDFYIHKEDVINGNTLLTWTNMYLRQIIKGWNSHILFFLLLSVITWIINHDLKLTDRINDKKIIFLAWVLIGIRIILHPEIADRFFIAYYLLFIIVLLYKISDKYERAKL